MLIYYKFLVPNKVKCYVCNNLTNYVYNKSVHDFLNNINNICACELHAPER